MEALFICAIVASAYFFAYLIMIVIPRQEIRKQRREIENMERQIDKLSKMIDDLERMIIDLNCKH